MNDRKSTELQKVFWKSYKNRRMIKMPKVFFYRSSKNVLEKL
jgi:hypothetical protein